MKIIKGICKVIDKINDVLGSIFSVLVLGIMGVIMCEVVLRRLFNKPQIWTQDLTIMLFGAYTILICAYGFQKKAFVAVDVVYAKFPKLMQYIVHIVTYFIYLVPFAFWIVPKTYKYFMKAFTSGEMRYSVWSVPTWPVKCCFFIGFTLLAVQTVSEMLKVLVELVEHLQGKKASKALPDDGEGAQA